MSKNIIDVSPLETNIDHGEGGKILSELIEVYKFKAMIYDQIKNAVEEMVSNIGLADILLEADDDSFDDDFMSWDEIVGQRPGIRYSGSDEKFHYLIRTYIVEKEDGYSIAMQISRNNSSGYEAYNIYQKRWEKTTAFSLFGITEKQMSLGFYHPSKGSLFECVHDIFGPMTDQEFDSFCGKNAKMLLLHERLDGLMKFAIIPKSGNSFETFTPKSRNYWLALVPDEIFCHGLAVIYQDSKYRLCQYIEEDVILEIRDENDNDQYLRIVGNSKELDRVVDSLEMMTNQYFGCDDTFVAPLSWDAYARTTDFDRYALMKNGKPDLTPVEKENLDKFQEFVDNNL